MKRRHFVKINLLGSTSLLLFGIGCTSENDHIDYVLTTPTNLSKILNNKSIEDIGKKYLKNNPSENNYAVLKKKLLKNIDVLDHDSNFIIKSLGKKIKLDYENENICVVDGWILSETEVRQCALNHLK